MKSGSPKEATYTGLDQIAALIPAREESNDWVWGSAGAPQLKLKKTDTVVFVIDILSVEPTKVLSGPKGRTVKAPASAPVVKQTGATEWIQHDPPTYARAKKAPEFYD